MTDGKFQPFDDPELDAKLKSGLDALPPTDDVVRLVTPWRRAMNRILSGLALCSVTLNFLCLNYILPTIGLILMLLGCRALRRANGAFRLGFIICVVRTAICLPILMLGATVWRGAAYELPVFAALNLVNIALTLIQMLALRGALRGVQEKSGMEPHSGGATGLIIWYLVVCALALLGFVGLIIPILLIVAYVFIIVSLRKLSAALDEAGYSVSPAPPRISDRVLAWTLIGVTLIGIIAGYAFLGRYPMDWTEHEPSQSAQAASVRAELIELGFPETVLNDMTDEDVLSCSGALRVVVSEGDYAMNDGREVVTRVGNGTHHSRVYDVKELRVTAVGVELPGQREKWKLIHHFVWTIPPDFYGTEAIQLWSAGRTNMGWRTDGEYRGRVLCQRDGATYAAPYYSLDEKTFESNSIFWGGQTSTDVFAEFSFPRGSELCRGYVAYDALENIDGYLMDSWMNYVHQQTFLQYPAQTALESLIGGAFSIDDPFRMVQTALQFRPEAEVLKPLG